MSSSVERKLAAIMFTDIAGFTALSGKDETKALSLLDKQKEVIVPILDEFNGTLHKEMGDGLLFTFPTVTEAVKCAIKIQEVTKSVDELNLRIGIHEGEITFKDGDVLGDDVNVASRIEPFAPVGGIAISGKVQQNISSLPEFQTDFVGNPSLKGVSQDVKVYCITSHGLPLPDKSKISAKLEEQAKPRFNIFALTGAILTVTGIGFWIAVGVFGLSFGTKYEVPSVGILMMENLGSEEDNFWARGITGDLIIKVASSGNIRVPSIKEIVEVDISETFEKIAERLNVKYILTSELYKDENKFELRSQLINANTGVSEYANKWTETNDKSAAIVSTLAEQLLSILFQNSELKVKVIEVNSDSYKNYMKAKAYAGYDMAYNDITTEELKLARKLLAKSIAFDSTNIDAQIQLARSFFYNGLLDTAIIILERSVSICNITNQEKLLGRVYRNLGNALLSKWSGGKGILSELPSLENYHKAAQIAEKHNDLIGYTEAQSNIISQFFTWRDSDTSNDTVHFYAEEMLEFAAEKNNIKIEAKAYYKLGLFYQWSGDHRNKIRSNYYFKKAYKLSLDLNNEFQFKCLNSLYEMADRNDNHYGKIEYLEKAQILAEKMNSNKRIVESLVRLGSSFGYPMSSYEKQENLLDKAISYKKILHSFGFYEWRIYLFKAQSALEMGNYKTARDLFIKADTVFSHISDYKIFSHNKNLGLSYYYLQDSKKANEYFTKAIEFMQLSNAVKDDIDLFLYQILTEIKTGNIHSPSDSIVNPLSSKKYNTTINNLADYFLKAEKEESEWGLIYGRRSTIYYNFYHIFNLLGQQEEAKSFINLAYEEIMKTGSTLNKKDKNRFLTENKLVSEIIKGWQKHHL